MPVEFAQETQDDASANAEDPAPAGRPAHQQPAGSKPGETADTLSDDDDDDEQELPQIMHVSSMSRNEKNRVARIVTPKKYTGRLEVPQDIFKMWQTAKGKQQLFELWAKSGGVKAWQLLQKGSLIFPIP